MKTHTLRRWKEDGRFRLFPSLVHPLTDLEAHQASHDSDRKTLRLRLTGLFAE